MRLLQSGIINRTHTKYQNELQQRNPVLAYYIAAINIESTYHDNVTKGEEVEYNRSMESATDTFQTREKGPRT